MARLTNGYGAAVRRRARMVAVLAEPEDLTTPRLRGLAEVADVLEVRADLVGDPDPRRLRRHFQGPLTYSLRSPRHGGRSAAGPVERRARLLRAADHYDLVDLEAMDDVVPELLAGIPARQRRISWHAPARPERADRGCRAGLLAASGALRERFAAMAAVPAALYLLVPQSGAEYGSVSPLLLTGLGRTDVTAFASGPAGTWTRVLAPWLGAPVVFGRAGAPGADGMPSVGQLLSDYGLPALPPLSGLFGIAGRAPGRSLSPRLHNAALRELGLPALYLPFQVELFSRFWHWAFDFESLGGLPLRGLTVTAPHKESALEAADIADPEALGCGAANLLWLDAGRWRAATTDTVAALHTLARSGVDPSGRRAAVIGCGGAGRAVAWALRRAGARVTLVNRGIAHGLAASSRLGLPYVPLSRFSPAGYAVLAHATPLVEREPFPVAAADSDAAVLEMAYREPPSALMGATRARGLIGIDGWDVLFVEVREQFRLLTGHPMPEALSMHSLCSRPAGRADAHRRTESAGLAPRQPTSREAP
ncbi:type I 3-dehydroquinate dehydratase [Actinacidiphila oryziradicis]|uniref:type I 3-dehydroquinate dehydratase n=1 Tax=Actinacidiphila oryziradicis TaxID=2571141 RepID=UPI00145C9D96|nr:type I 3-dehydroquinate dehydratase [Actinacidiphila oryziradicis]